MLHTTYIHLHQAKIGNYYFYYLSHEIKIKLHIRNHIKLKYQHNNRAARRIIFFFFYLFCFCHLNNKFQWATHTAKVFLRGGGGLSANFLHKKKSKSNKIFSVVSSALLIRRARAHSQAKVLRGGFLSMQLVDIVARFPHDAGIYICKSRYVHIVLFFVVVVIRLFLYIL